LKLTADELAAMPAKARKNPETVQLYEQHEFMTAYAMHTDARVQTNGYRGAIGAVDDWDKYGDLSLAMLQAQGMHSPDTLLDYGCGTGRLARKAVPWLLSNRYYGVDISRTAIMSAQALAVAEGWAARNPWLGHNGDLGGAVQFDYAWAFSVMIHLPLSEVRNAFTYVRERLAPGGVFLCSYVPEKVNARTGLKQFRHTRKALVNTARSAGFAEFTDVTESWGGSQRIGRFC
jgi:SAM-dependent methyltransferase